MLYPDLNLTGRREAVMNEFFPRPLEDLPHGRIEPGDLIGSGYWVDAFLIKDTSPSYPKQVLKVLRVDPGRVHGDGVLAIEKFAQNIEALNQLFFEGAQEMKRMRLPLQVDETYMLRYPFPMKTGTFRGNAAVIEMNLNIGGECYFGQTRFEEKMRTLTPNERLGYWRSLFLRLGKADEWGVVNYDLTLGNVGFISSSLSERPSQRKYVNTPSFIDFGVSFVRKSRYNRRQTNEFTVYELMKLPVDERERILRQCALNDALSGDNNVFNMMRIFESGDDSLIDLTKLESFRNGALRFDEPFKEIHQALYNRDYARGLE